MSKRFTILLTGTSIALAMSFTAFAQEPARGGARAEGGPKQVPLFFREDWKQVPKGGEHAVTEEATANPNLELKLYGDGKDIQLTGSADSPVNPIHLWTGLCTTPCAATLRDKNNYVDLTGSAKIRWNTKTSGFHKVHPVLKLADGTWLVGDYGAGVVSDWHNNEFSVSDIHWIKLDINKVVTRGMMLPKVDLSKVDEVGFTDLYPGSGHGQGGWVDVAGIEVYGKPVSRSGATQTSENR